MLKNIHVCQQKSEPQPSISTRAKIASVQSRNYFIFKPATLFQPFFKFSQPVIPLAAKSFMDNMFFLRTLTLNKVFLDINQTENILNATQTYDKEFVVLQKSQHSEGQDKGQDKQEESKQSGTFKHEQPFNSNPNNKRTGLTIGGLLGLGVAGLAAGYWYWNDSEEKQRQERWKTENLEHLPTTAPYFIETHAYHEVVRLFQEEGKQLVVLAGLSGSGKSELAKKYAHALLENKSLPWIAFLSAEDEAAWQSSLRTLIKRLCDDDSQRTAYAGWLETQHYDELYPQLIHQLKQKKSPIFFILDEAPSLSSSSPQAKWVQSVCEHLNQTQNSLPIQLLITSQNSAFVPGHSRHTIINLSGPKWKLNNEEGLHLFYRIMPKANFQRADNYELEKLIVDQCDKLPVAIVQLAHYAKGKKIETVKQLEEILASSDEQKLILEDTLNKLTQPQLELTYKKNVFKILLLSIEQFKEEYKDLPEAWQMLVWLSLMKKDNISEALILDYLTARDWKQPTQVWPHIQSALQAYSLIFHFSSKGYTIQKLLQQTILLKFIEEASVEDKEILFSTSLTILEKIAKTPLATYQEKMHHLDQLVDNLKQCSKFEFEYHKAASDIYNTLGNLHINFETTVHLHQSIYYYEQALAIQKKQLGDEHPNIASSYHNLANAYSELGGQANVAKAIEYYEHALAIQKKQLGDQHPNVASSYNNLAIAYSALGGQANVAKAIGYYEHALAIQKKQLGEEHPAMATSYHNLAAAYQNLGGQANVTKAIEYYEQALATQRKQLGEEHPNVAISYYSLAAAYQNLGGQANVTKAIRYAEQALVIERQQWGEEHPTVASSYNNLALMYSNLGGQANITKAIEYAEQALAIRRKQWGEEHLDVASSYNNLAIVYSDLGGQANITKAIGYYKQALAIRRKQLGEEHPHVAISYGNLAEAYLDLGDPANITKAVDYAEKTLKIFKKQLGAQHPYIAKSHVNLIRAYQAVDIEKEPNFFKERCALIEEIQAYFAKEYSKDDAIAKALAEILNTDCKVEERSQMKIR